MITSGLNFLIFSGDGAAEGEAVLDHTVGESEEFYVVDADDSGAVDFLLHSEPSGLVGVHGVDARLTLGDHQVADLLALRSPAGDGAGCAVFEVVRVGGDGQGAVPVFREV